MSSKRFSKKKRADKKHYRICEYKATNIKAKIQDIFECLMTAVEKVQEAPSGEVPDCDISTLKKFDTEKLKKHLDELEFKYIDLEQISEVRQMLADYPPSRVKEAMAIFKKAYGFADRKACEQNKILHAKLREDIKHLADMRTVAERQKSNSLDFIDRYSEYLDSFKLDFDRRFGRFKHSSKYISKCKCYTKRLEHIQSTQNAIDDAYAKVADCDKRIRSLQLEIVQKQNELNAISCNDALLPIEMLYGFLRKIDIWLRYHDRKPNSATAEQPESSDPRVLALRSIIVTCKLDDRALLDLADEAEADDHPYNAALLSELMNNGCIQDKYDGKFERVKRDFYKAVGFDTKNMGSSRKDMSGKDKTARAKEFVAILLEDTSKRKTTTKP